MHIVGQFLWILAAWRWGDWRNWEKYHSTILYMIVVALLYEVLMYHYSLWTYSDILLPTHTLNSIAVTFIGFSCSVLIFLSHYPEKSVIKQIKYVLLWTALYIAIEYFFLVIDLFHHHNGWNIWWSTFFVVTMFPLLVLHHKKPLIAYLISLPILIIYLVIFDVPISGMK